MGNNKKGDVLSIAQLTEICGTKRTADLIPLCHPIPIDAVSVDLQMIEGGVPFERPLEQSGKQVSKWKHSQP